MKRIFLIIVLIITPVILTLFLYSFSNPSTSISDTNTGSNEVTLAPYPTEIIPGDIFWSDDNNILAIYENTLIKLSTKDFKTETIIDNLTIMYKEFLSRTMKIGDGMLCDTYNFVITDPKESATKIVVYEDYDLSNPEILETNLTIEVDQCSDPLILSNSFPFLKESHYSWDVNKPAPQESEGEKMDEWNILNSENETTLSKNDQEISFETVADFIIAIPNENTTRFALISNTGELWILSME